MLTPHIGQLQGWLVDEPGHGGECHYFTYGSHRAACGLWLPLGFWEGSPPRHRPNTLTYLRFDWATRCPACLANLLKIKENAKVY